MDDLISRQLAIDAADYTDYRWLTIEDVKKVTDEVVKELKKLPPVDAVQVIRCKDCKYYKENTLVCSRYGLEDDDYCSWAERKEE